MKEMRKDRMYAGLFFVLTEYAVWRKNHGRGRRC